MERLKGSSITRLPTTDAASNGAGRGETGYAELVPYTHRNPEHYGAIPPGPLQQIVSASALSLTNWINMKRSLPADVSKADAEAELARALTGVRRALAPATAEEIASALEAIAQVFRAPLPEATGLKIYVSVLQDVPGLAFKEACRRIVKTHKYPNLPVPQDLIAAAASTTIVLEAWKTRLDMAANRLASL